MDVASAAFEQLVVDVLRSMGYGGPEDDAARVIGGSGDEGIDGVIREDRLGLEMIYQQAEAYARSIQVTIVLVVGVTTGNRYDIRRLDSDYFAAE